MNPLLIAENELSTCLSKIIFNNIFVREKISEHLFLEGSNFKEQGDLITLNIEYRLYKVRENVRNILGGGESNKDKV